MIIMFKIGEWDIIERLACMCCMGDKAIRNYAFFLTKLNEIEGNMRPMIIH
jgi:hypothetical protein